MSKWTDILNEPIGLLPLSIGSTAYPYLAKTIMIIEFRSRYKLHIELNLLKFNNKDTRMTSLDIILVSFCKP